MGAYEDPRIIGVPLPVNRGTPMRHEGIVMSRRGSEVESKSSIVRGRYSSKGFEMTILKAPGSESFAADTS